MPKIARRRGEGGGDVTDVLWGHSEHITVIEQQGYANICILFEPLNEIGSALFSEKLVSTKSKTPMQQENPKSTKDHLYASQPQFRHCYITVAL
eukprot:scaffold7665_cov137-Skeletonema_marinoi.AAC.4